MKKIIFSDEKIQKIINLYLKENKSLSFIGELFNCNRNVIKRILIENNVSLRQRTHKYSANYDIFEKIDSNEKAYWLGFLAADGCNYQRKQNASIIINIHQKDIEQLKKFKNFCQTEAEIVSYITSVGFSNNTPMCKIVLNSKKMSLDLADKGIVPQKSLILKPPKIEQKYYLPFILGYFDGDGSIYKTSQYNNYSLSFQGTKEILIWICDVLKLEIPLEQRKESVKNEYYIRCGGTNKPYNILKQLYNSCEIHLERKYQIYKELETVVLNRNIK